MFKNESNLFIREDLSHEKSNITSSQDMIIKADYSTPLLSTSNKKLELSRNFINLFRRNMTFDDLMTLQKCCLTTITCNWEFIYLTISMNGKKLYSNQTNINKDAKLNFLFDINSGQNFQFIFTFIKNNKQQ